MLNSKRHIWGKTPLLLGAVTAFAFGLSTPTLAQDSDKTQIATVNSKAVLPSEGLNLNLGSNFGSDFSPDYTGHDKIIDLPMSSVGSSLFKLDIADPKCLAGSSQCLRRDDQIDIGATKQFTSLSKKGLDLTLTPRASVRFDNENSSALVGAVVEIGEDLRKGSDFKNNTWYIFAGADAEALTYAPNSIGRLTRGQFHLQDRIIVGDAQAGVGYRIGDADVSLSYMRREASSQDFSYSEDAAALSFTWKR